MMRGLTAIRRSTVAAPAKLFHRNGLSDFTKLRPLPLARNFNTYAQPFPYYGGCQYDPYHRYYANRNAYQLNPNFSHFHPGVYGPHPRFGCHFRGDFTPYPVGGAWRSFGPEYRCRCCGFQQFLPVNYGGSWNWNPNAGMYRGGVVQGNGYVDQGINYNRGHRSHTFRNDTGGGRGNFNGNDGRNLGPYGANSTDFPRNQNDNGGRDYNANQNHNQNVGQHGQNLGDIYNERQELSRVNGFEEQKIAHDGYRRPQDAYRYNNNFTENDGRDGRDQVAWTQSRSSYNHYGPEHSFHSESERLNQGTGYVDRKNVNADNQTRPANNGGAIGGQFQNSTVNGRPLNSNGAGGGEEYKQTGQSSRLPDVLRKDNNHGSNEHNWSVNSQSGSNPVGGQYEKRFNVANNGESSRLFQDNKGVKQDGVISRYDESRNGSNLGNMFDPLPDFTANEPLNPSRTNAQMPNINETGNSGGRPPHSIVHDSNDATRMSIDASRRGRRIVDVLDSEDYPRPNRTST
ncbi:unnamed protein product [Rhodiola kirilowii]